MNKDRRKRLGALNADIAKLLDSPELLALADAQEKFDAAKQALIDARAALAGSLDDISGPLEDIKDEEQEAFNNLSESLQGGERGQAMESAVSEMDSALEALSALKYKLEDEDAIAEHDESEIRGELEEVNASIDNAGSAS